jgi:hypothetical protein
MAIGATLLAAGVGSALLATNNADKATIEQALRSITPVP